MSDKRLTVEDMVAELLDGMTIGIGGWGSRRKPMAAVRAILRAGVRDLTVVSYGGPDVGLLCAAGRVPKAVYAFVTLDSIALDPHFQGGPAGGTIEAMEIDEGMFYLGCWPRRSACRSCRPGPDSVPTCWWSTPGCAPSARPMTTARSWWPCRPCASTPPSST